MLNVTHTTHEGKMFERETMEFVTQQHRALLNLLCVCDCELKSDTHTKMLLATTLLSTAKRYVGTVSKIAKKKSEQLRNENTK